MSTAAVILIGDNEFIKNRLLANVSVLQQHQFLRTTLAEINALVATCGTCTGKTTVAEENIRKKWNSVRKYLVELPEDQRQVIKDLAKIKPNQRVRISFTNGSGAATDIQKRFF